jgi:hypothetical protein
MPSFLRSLPLSSATIAFCAALKRPDEKKGMQMEQQEILFQIKLHKPKAYFVYSEDWVVHNWGKRSADTLQTHF